MLTRESVKDNSAFELTLVLRADGLDELLKILTQARKQIKLITDPEEKTVFPIRVSA